MWCVRATLWACICVGLSAGSFAFNLTEALESAQGFGFEVVCERSSLLYLFLNGNLAILLFKF